mmetsp:Transcript_65293/g.156050  ORF Transcript_65293/g.156050 Transcript_65293/m.156050 type:complete len:165 (-) Transcript_65293:125-619(-)|eukprot:CAMPEP_0178423592 /NCGR_PEP_ID=MMETSP0689_2-20121128/27768_1 /TAXON_ID=160604 /ORGANISM="Amphidinium massartii, Strain CS-259" /LENGTH=164 /DNA_ID=CAMNT_0020045191 /DNA_START=41 /DNA_END=535 /DNA_ORIENTATION=+
MDWLMLIGAGMLTFVFFVVFFYLTGCYRLLPHWGPIVKFDGHGDENLRLNQFLVYEHVVKTEQEKLNEAKQQRGPNGEKILYGAPGMSGNPTWGRCEGPMREVPIVHPLYGNCIMREGWHETQKLREQCEWWGKDETYFMQQRGEHSKPPEINDRFYVAPQRMT